MTYERYIPDCPECGTKMIFLTEIISDIDYSYEDGYLSDISCSRDEMFQCLNCKRIVIK